MLQQVVPLELLRAGESGRIEDLDGNAALVCRLEEMGLRRGVHVRMIQPGSPCIVAVEGHRLSFRGDEAAILFVAVGE